MEKNGKKGIKEQEKSVKEGRGKRKKNEKKGIIRGRGNKKTKEDG